MVIYNIASQELKCMGCKEMMLISVVGKPLWSSVGAYKSDKGTGMRASEEGYKLVNKIVNN